MQSETGNLIAMALAFLSLFGVAEILHHGFNVKAEYTRKLVHAGTGLLTLIFPLVFSSIWPVAFLCGSFALILLLSLRFKLLKSINGISRVSHGSLAYPASVLVTFIFFTGYTCLPGSPPALPFFYIPVLVLALADPAAALVGKRWPAGTYRVGSETKSLTGSISFFVIALLTTLLILNNGDLCRIPFSPLIFAGILAITTTLAEAFSRKGLDNLFVPAVAILTIFALYHSTGP